MRLVLISDTHNQHAKLILPKGDVIIHAGDISGNGTLTEVMNFVQWFSNLPFRHKIFIAGNHDFAFENKVISSADFPSGVVYLENSYCEILGLKIFGSPYTPEFYNWAFMKKRGEQIRQIWNLIPSGIDVLITHGPPFMILDENSTGRYQGCEDLLKKIKELKPKLHVFGHIHEGYGYTEQFGIRFVNASVLDGHYKLVNKPVVIDL